MIIFVNFNKKIFVEITAIDIATTQKINNAVIICASKYEKLEHVI